MQSRARIFRVCLFLVCVLLYTTEAAITGWTTPDITGKDVQGTLTVSESQAISDTITTYEANTNTNGAAITYTLVAPVAPFALSSTGDLTISASLDFETAASYTLEIQAVETDSTADGTGIATITVTVTDVNEAPVFTQTSYTTQLANGSPAETTVITVSATDPEGDTLTYSIEPSGNTNTDFKIDSTSGEIKVNTGKTLDVTVTPTYTLIVHAVDNNAPPLTGSTTVSIEVTADGNGSGAAAVVVSTITVLLTLFVRL